MRTREYLMIYRGPGFLAVVHIIRLLAMHPLSSLSLQQVVSLSQSSLCRRSSLLSGDVGEEPNHTTARKPDPLQIIQYSLLRD